MYFNGKTYIPTHQFGDKMKILIDFDRTICPNSDPSNPPTLDCLRTINRLKQEGHTIIIWSVRSNINETGIPDGHNEMLEYLDKYKIPFDDINCTKIHCDLMIDDRCACIYKDTQGNVDWSVLKNKL
jgi:hypothetical protein